MIIFLILNYDLDCLLQALIIILFFPYCFCMPVYCLLWMLFSFMVLCLYFLTLYITSWEIFVRLICYFFNVRRGKFNVKSYYKSLRAENSLFFPAKEIWGSYAPLRTHFFAWEAVWGKILTIDMLMKRGWSMVNRCSLCKKNEKSVDHILIHCGKTRELWTLLLSSFGLVWVFPA